MKGLLNLLTVLAALLNLVTGCGLRGRAPGSALLRVGSLLAQQRLSAGSTTGAMAAMGAALGGSSGGSLLGGITSPNGGGLAGALLNGASGLTASGGGTVLQTHLGAIGAQIGSGSQASVLTDLKNLAVQRLAARVSSGGSGSGPTIPISGPQPGAGLVQTGRLAAAGFLMTASTASRTATGITTQLGGSSIGNVAGAVPGPGTGSLLGVSSSGGTNPLGGPGRGLQNIGQVSNGASLRAVSAVVNTATRLGGHFGGSPVTNVPGVPTTPAGVGTIATHASRISESTSSLVASGPGAGPGPQEAFPTAGTGGNWPGATGTPAAGPGFPASTNPGQLVGQVLPQNSGVLRRGLENVAATATTAASLGASVAGTTVHNIMGGVNARVGRVQSGVNGLDASDLNSGRGPRPQGALYGAGTGAQLQSNNEALAARGLNGVGLSAGRAPGSSHTFSETTILSRRQQVQEQVLAGQQNSGLLGGGPLVGGGAAGNPTLGPGEQPVGSSGQNLMATDARLTGVVSGGDALGGSPRGPAASAVTSVAGQVGAALGIATAGRALGTPGGVGMDGRGLNGGIGSGPSSSGTESGAIEGVNTGLVFRQSAQQISQTVSGGSLAPGGNGANPAPGLGVRPEGISGHLQGTATSVSSASSFGAASSGTSGLTFSGTGPGGDLGQVPGQETRPISHGPSQGSVVSVTTSSHSTSSFQSQHVSHSQGHMGSPLPGLGGGGTGGVYPSGAIGPGRTGTGAGGDLLGAIVAAGTGGGTASGPGRVPALGVGGLSSNGASVLGSSSTISGMTQHSELHKRRRMSGAAAAGIALGSVAGALAISAIGAGIAGAIQSGMGAGPRRVGGCSGGGCGSRCGRKRRSLPQSKVPEEVLSSISTNFDRLY